MSQPQAQPRACPACHKRGAACKCGVTEAPCRHCEGGIAIPFTHPDGRITLEHGCDRLVEGWAVDGEGFVLVDGSRVMNAKSAPIKVRRTCNLTCQHCKQVNVEAPLVLYKRFERHLGRQMYWFGLPEGSWGEYRFCATCPEFGS